MIFKKRVKKEYIIPIFVPNLGCPNDCTFCNQKSISGEQKMITTKDENGNEKKGACIFSMGNFFSAQTFPNTRNTVVLNVKIRNYQDYFL